MAQWEMRGAWERLPPVRAALCSASELLSASGEWSRGFGGNGVLWHPLEPTCAFRDYIRAPLPKPVAFATLGDTHLKDMVVSLCKRLEALGLRTNRQAGGASAGLAVLFASCTTADASLRAVHRPIHGMSDEVIKVVPQAIDAAIKSLGR